jgi:ribonuclease HI
MTTLFDKAPAHATLFADGGSRGNPGPAASGAVIVNPAGEVVAEAGRFLGIATNNVAEWTALLIGLEAAAQAGIRRLDIRMDSELVVKQVRGEYRVKHESLQPLHRKALALLRGFEQVDIKHVPRKLNKLADSLVNAVLDREADLRRLE